MQHHPPTTIDLPPRISQARHWRGLAAEIHDALVDAIHHSLVLDGVRRPALRVVTSAHLLPHDQRDPDMLDLHHWLVSQCIDHHFGCRESAAVHRIHIRLQSIDAPGRAAGKPLSQNTPPQRISPRLSAKPNLDWRTTMHADPRISIIPDAVPRKPKKKSWLAGLVDWLFGPPADEDDAPPAAKPEPRRSPPPAEPGCERPAAGTATPCVEVEHKGNWLESFNSALTQATADFIRTWVEPLHKQDATCVYSIRAVKVAMSEAAAPCLEVLERVPPEVLNRVAKIRLKQAHGQHQILLDNFYGLSIAADSTLLGDHVVQTLVSYSNRRFYLVFEFDGEYVMLPAHALAGSAQTASETGAIMDFGGEPKERPALQKETTPVAGGYAPLSTKEATPVKSPTLAPHCPPVIARLFVKPWNGEAQVVEISERQLPFSIGREPDGQGFDLAPDDAAPDTARYVSRLHLTLKSFDALAEQFFIYNPGHASNGTYDKGHPMPERFIYRCDSNRWLSLGGQDGEGTVQIKLELP